MPQGHPTTTLADLKRAAAGTDPALLRTADWEDIGLADAASSPGVEVAPDPAAELPPALRRTADWAEIGSPAASQAASEASPPPVGALTLADLMAEAKQAARGVGPQSAALRRTADWADIGPTGSSAPRMTARTPAADPAMPHDMPGVLPPRGLMMSAAIGSLALVRLVDDRTSAGEAAAAASSPPASSVPSGEVLPAPSAPEPPPARTAGLDVALLAAASDGDKARGALPAVQAVAGDRVRVAMPEKPPLRGGDSLSAQLVDRSTSSGEALSARPLSAASEVAAAGDRGGVAPEPPPDRGQVVATIEQGLSGWLASEWPADKTTIVPELFQRDLVYLIDQLVPLLPQSRLAGLTGDSGDLRGVALERPAVMTAYAEPERFDVQGLLRRLQGGSAAAAGGGWRLRWTLLGGDAQDRNIQDRNTVAADEAAPKAPMTLERLALAVTSEPEDGVAAAPIAPLEFSLADLTDGAESPAEAPPSRGTLSLEKLVRLAPPKKPARRAGQGVSLERVVRTPPPKRKKLARRISPIKPQRVKRRFDVASLNLKIAPGTSAASLARFLEDVSVAPPPPIAARWRLASRPMSFDQLLSRAGSVSQLFSVPGASKARSRRSELVRDLRHVRGLRQVRSLRQIMTSEGVGLQ